MMQMGALSSARRRSRWQQPSSNEPYRDIDLAGIGRRVSRLLSSLTWHPSACPQHYQFSRRAISPRCFYARGGRWSFHTAWVIHVDFGTSAYPPLATEERTSQIGSFVP